MSRRLSAARWPAAGVVAVALVAAVQLAGCTSPHVSDADELAAFRSAGPLRPTVDTNRLLRAKAPVGLYRTAPGDVLELRLPPALLSVVPERTGGEPRPLLARIDRAGNVRLPVVGDVHVADRTLVEVEGAVADAYFPRYAVTRPTVVAGVVEYDTRPVCVLGAVEEPGVYQLRRDEMSLVNALMKAGGIAGDGAAAIRIRSSEGEAPEPLLVPIKGLNIPFSDVALEPGVTVEVERLRPEFFTVIGLVRSPGAFAYPAGTRYNLMQALAFAGGVNELADPRHVTVYRQDAAGRIVSATFNLQGDEETDVSTVAIKPGDVVAVEQTDRTSARLLVAEILRIHLGINAAGLFRYERIEGSQDYDYH